MGKVLFLVFLIFSIFATSISFVSSYECTDTDNGLNSAVQGTVEFNSYKYKDHCAQGYEDAAVNGVPAERGDVVEYACNSAEGNPLCTATACRYSILKCGAGETCVDGACAPETDDPFYLPKGVSCQDSDNGVEFRTRGLVTYRTEDGSVAKQEDYCVTDKELREWSCKEGEVKPLVASSEECSGVCACGRCFEKNEEAVCETDYKKYCDSESCYIVEKDIDIIKFVNKKEVNDGCIGTKNSCVKYIGEYTYEGNNIFASVEPDANLDFAQLQSALKKKYNQEPYIDDKVYIIDNHDTLSVFWISNKKLISLEMPTSLTGPDREDEYIEGLAEEYLKVHPSDIQKNLNFFEKVIDWFKKLLGINSSPVKLAPPGPPQPGIPPSEINPIGINATNKSDVCIAVRTPQDLDNVRTNLLGHYCQMNDINLKNYNNWEPIGSPNNPFKGTYKGNGYTIRNLRAIHPEKDYGVGLFGYIWSAKVENLRLLNFSTDGKSLVGSLSGGAIDSVFDKISCDLCSIKGTQSIGGLMGYAAGGFADFKRTLITNSFVINSVLDLKYSPDMENSPIEAGGLVGFTNDALIMNSYSDVSINGSIEGDAIGGMVGSLGYVSHIEQSFSKGKVFGENYIGGLVGYNYGVINNSYSFSNVSADTTESTTQGGVGGLVGINAGNVTYSYSAGKVFARADYPCPGANHCLGGLIGRNNFVSLPTNVSFSYWDINTSGQSVSAGGQGKTTAQMKQQSTYQNWDFAKIWKIAPNEYPKLKWQN